MVKRNLLKEEFPELESSDVEINFDSYNTDFDKESDNICSEYISTSDSDSNVVLAMFPSQACIPCAIVFSTKN